MNKVSVLTKSASDCFCARLAKTVSMSPRPDRALSLFWLPHHPQTLPIRPAATPEQVLHPSATTRAPCRNADNTSASKTCGVRARLSVSVKMPVEKSIAYGGTCDNQHTRLRQCFARWQSCKMAVLQKSRCLFDKSVAFDQAQPAQLHVEEVCLLIGIGGRFGAFPCFCRVSETLADLVSFRSIGYLPTPYESASALRTLPLITTLRGLASHTEFFGLSTESCRRKTLCRETTLQ